MKVIYTCRPLKDDYATYNNQNVIDYLTPNSNSGPINLTKTVTYVWSGLSGTITSCLMVVASR